MAAVQTSGKSGILYYLFGCCVMLHENHVFIKKKKIMVVSLEKSKNFETIAEELVVKEP